VRVQQHDGFFGVKRRYAIGLRIFALFFSCADPRQNIAQPVGFHFVGQGFQQFRG
jgi:hypothetical protein